MYTACFLIAEILAKAKIIKYLEQWLPWQVGNWLVGNKKETFLEEKMVHAVKRRRLHMYIHLSKLYCWGVCISMSVIFTLKCVGVRKGVEVLMK